MTTSISSRLSLLCGLALAVAPLPLAADSASFNVPLAAIGPDLDARGVVTGKFGLTKSSLTLSCSRLDPSLPFELWIDGQLQGQGSSTRGGSLLIRLRSPDKKGYQRFDFDPRGKQIQVLQNGTAILDGVFSGEGEAEKSRVFESAQLRNLTGNSRARASAEVSRRTDQSMTLTVRCSRLAAADGAVSLFVNGQLVGLPGAVGKTGSVLLRFRSPVKTGYQELNFDPRGALIDLVQKGAVIFTGTLKARARGANFDRRAAFVLPLPAVSENAIGSAKAKWRVDERARRKLEIEVEDAPEGDYAFLVDGVARGTIQVVSDGEGGTEGEIEFANDDDDQEALPLDFDPLGAVLAVAAGDEIWFSRLFTPSELNSKPASEPASSFEENLASTGLITGAKAEARYEVDDKGRHRFKVSLEKVAPGSYPLLVGGVQRALIRVVAPPAAPKSARKGGDDDDDDDDDAGQPEGEVEFRSVVEPRKILLNFDPRGQLLEILTPAGDILFSHILGSGSAAGGAGGDVVLPLFISQPLFAQAGAVGSVQATLQRKERGDLKLKLKARGLPVGNYDVEVGGQVRGALAVTPDDGGTEGEIEFESEADDDDLPLDFEVNGAEIAVIKNGVTLFARVLDLP